MSKDSSHHYVHLAQSRFADIFEEFTRPPHLPHEPINVAPQHQPPNPEDEDDFVPDQHAAFGIARATQARREVAWRDLNLEGLMNRGPSSTSGTGLAGGGSGAAGGPAAAGGGGVGPGATGADRRGTMPR